MNNNFMPPFNMEQNEIKRLNDKVEMLDKKINKLEKKVQILENNNNFPTPMPYNYNMPFPNNYMM